MKLDTLGLEGFRNLRDGQLRFGPHRNLLVGPNGAGKTNLLEAVCVLARGYSPRTARDQELVQWGRSAFRLAGLAEGEARLRLELVYSGEKRCLLNGAEARLEETAALLPVVLFCPADTFLVQGGPVRRRRYLDRFLVLARPEYRRCWEQYRRALEQRNAALPATGPGADAALLPWEEQLAQAGGRLVAWRAEASSALGREAAAALAELVDGGERAVAVYRPAVPGLGAERAPGTPVGAAEATEALARALARSRSLDRARGATQVGPHRDDLLLLLGGREARHFASQGQQRSLALALRLAELRCLEAEGGVAPLLLLDDVASELDRGRRRRLLEVIPPHLQVFVTSAEDGLGDGLERPGGAELELFRVERGEVRPG